MSQMLLAHARQRALAALPAGGPSGRRYFIGLKAVGTGHLPHARIELAIDLAGQQFAGFEEYMQL